AELASKSLTFCFGREAHISHADRTPGINLAAVFATAPCLIPSRPECLDQWGDAHVYTGEQPTVGMTERCPPVFNERELQLILQHVRRVFALMPAASQGQSIGSPALSALTCDTANAALVTARSRSPG